MERFEIVKPRIAHYLLANAILEELASGVRLMEGLVLCRDSNCLLFQDLARDRTMRWTEDGGISTFRSASGYGNGQAWDWQGRLISCSHRERCLLRTELDGCVARLVDRHAGKRLVDPNDVIVESDGSIRFTDPLYRIRNDYEGGCHTSEQPPAVCRFDPNARSIARIAGDIDSPNGLAFSADERRVYVPETGGQTRDSPKQYISAFDISSQGELSDGELFHKIQPGYADGLCVDEDENLWSSAADGAHCISLGGELLGKVLVPYRVWNLTVGVPPKNRLFIGGSRTFYGLFLNRRGVSWP